MCQKWYKPLETYKKPLKVSISVIFRHFWAYLPQSRKLFHNKLWRVVKFIESCKKMVTNVNETPIESEFGVGTHKILFNYLFKVKCLSVSYTHTHTNTHERKPLKVNWFYDDWRLWFTVVVFNIDIIIIKTRYFQKMAFFPCDVILYSNILHDYTIIKIKSNFNVF